MMDLQALRRRMVEVAYRSGEGHLPSSLSCLEIIVDLYDRVLQPEDRFILSKGHACLALYAVLEAKGILPGGMLDTFCMTGSTLKGHPTIGTPGIVCSTGSLGHGITYAVGVAYTLKLKGSKGKVYCLVGDGECAEGSVYEAMMIAGRARLDNLFVVIDSNLSWLNRTEVRDLVNLFECERVDTIKGKGIKRMEADPQKYHHSKLSEQEYREIMEELGG